MAEFTSLVPVEVTVNGTIISGRKPEELVPRVPEAWTHKGPDVEIGVIKGDIEVVGAANGELWLSLIRSWNGPFDMFAMIFAKS